jgi:hypothetical protein
MKKTFIFSSILALFAVSCIQPEKSAPVAAKPAETTPTPKPEVPKAKFPVNCFEERLQDGSVLSIQYTEYYDEIVGILDYSFAEKDGAHGTFKGTKEGNIITATWSYVVEGSNQKEEIMIKTEGDKAFKASGELMETKGGLLKLKDPKNVTWSDEVFTRVQCD